MAESSKECLVFNFDFNDTKPLEGSDNLHTFTIPDSDYSYVLNKNEWNGFTGKVVWCPPDTLVNVSREEFSFLAVDAKYHKDSSGKGSVDKGIPKYTRIKARKIRGAISYGILAKYSGCLEVGQNAYEELECGHYDPEIAEISGTKGFSLGGDSCGAPSGHYPDYDVENFRKYGHKLFVKDEPCLVTVKINGSNSRIVYKDGEFHIGSHHQWKKESSTPPKLTLEDLIAKVGDETKAREVYERAVVNFKPTKNAWWRMFEAYPPIMQYCKNNEGYAVYGEMYGHVKGYNCGVPQGTLAFAAFDIKKPDGNWMNADEFLDVCNNNLIPTVPVIGIFPFDFDTFLTYSQGSDLIPGSTSLKEGCVVRPINERHDNKYGRVCLKIINPDYLLKK